MGERADESSTDPYWTRKEETKQVVGEESWKNKKTSMKWAIEAAPHPVFSYLLPKAEENDQYSTLGISMNIKFYQ